MTVTATMVKELRERTGAGMMECKRALTETGGELDAAAEALRKKGIAGADKKAGRIAAEGVVAVAFAGDSHCGSIVEINCETDFVAKDATFREFADTVAQCVCEATPDTVEALLALPMGASTVDGVRTELIAKIGENINIRRFATYSGTKIGGYVHLGGRIGVLVDLDGGRNGLDRDIAMHIAAVKPMWLSESDVPVEVLDKEREILAAQAAESGKPPQIIEKMIAGRISKYLKEITLLGQDYVRDSDISVGELLEKESATAKRFCRFEVGEGLEKKSDDFVAEVMAQARGEA